MALPSGGSSPPPLGADRSCIFIFLPYFDVSIISSCFFVSLLLTASPQMFCRMTRQLLSCNISWWRVLCLAIPLRMQSSRVEGRQHSTATSGREPGSCAGQRSHLPSSISPKHHLFSLLGGKAFAPLALAGVSSAGAYPSTSLQKGGCRPRSLLALPCPFPG